jgi:hypothetical protein
MSPTVFEPANSASEWPQTHTLNRATIGIGRIQIIRLVVNVKKMIIEEKSLCWYCHVFHAFPLRTRISEPTEFSRYFRNPYISCPFIGESTVLTEIFRSSCQAMFPRSYALEDSVTNGRTSRSCGRAYQLDALISQIYFDMKFYMFRTVRLFIIRSLFTVYSAMVYFTQVCGQLSSRTRMELQFHPGPARKLSTNLYDKYNC